MADPARSDGTAPPDRGGPPAIELADITTAFDGYEGLSQVSVSVPAGQITVLMGGSRSGKTLLIRHLLGQLRPDRGQVLINGCSIWELDVEQRSTLRNSTGVLRGGQAIQESEWDDSTTVEENLNRRLRDTTYFDGTQRQLQECLSDFDLQSLADCRPGDLDPSARRRLGVALALVGHPQLVVIDDPGTGIDFSHLHKMVRAVTTWQARTGATLLLTTHSLSVAKSLAEHVIVLSRGRVVAAGVPDQLLGNISNGTEFRRRFQTPLSVRESDPERLEHDGGESGLLTYLGRDLAQQGQMLVFVVLVILFGLLLTGVIPLLPG